MKGTVSGLMESRFVDLVTYRKDGRPISTPVLSVPRNGALLIRTHDNTGKLRRLRHNELVEVAPCDSRGRHLGPTERGIARVLPAEETAECLELLHRRHGMAGRVFTWLRHLLRQRDVFLEVRLSKGRRDFAALSGSDEGGFPLASNSGRGLSSMTGITESASAISIQAGVGQAGLWRLWGGQLRGDAAATPSRSTTLTAPR